MLSDGFGHHVWATLRLIEACRQLSPVQLESSVPGTYGSIIDTLRHLVGADSSYLHVIGGGPMSPTDHEHSGLDELYSAMEAHGPEWARVVESNRDPTEVVVRRRPDGSESHAPVGVRIAQVLHHGTDHRSQICTALTNLGVEPPEIDVWAYAWEDDRLVEIEPD